LKQTVNTSAFFFVCLSFFSCASQPLPERAPPSEKTEKFEASPEIIEIIDDSSGADPIGILPEPELEDKAAIVPLPEEVETPFEIPFEFVRAEPEYSALVPVAAGAEADEPVPPAEPPVAENIPAAEVEVAVVPEPAPPPEPPAPPRIVQAAERAPPPVAVSAPPPSVNLPARIHPTETEPKEKDSFSREIRAVSGQLVEVPFWGTGWVFLGVVNSNRGLSYDSRRLDDEGQTFVFRAAAPGEYFLKFNKQDYVSNYYVNDTVKVTVGENVAGVPLGTLSGARVSAPRWAPNRGGETASGAARNNAAGQPAQETSPSPAAPERPVAGAAAMPVRDTAADDAGAPAASAGAVSDGALAPVVTDAVAETPAPDYLGQARATFDAGNFAGTISALDLLRYAAPALDDDAWWLYGQSFEANGPARDIKAAVDAYQHITREFPQSPHYDAARSRIAYLNKFYFNIR
jgi:hypothetical protein